jgi:hypothetical protein
MCSLGIAAASVGALAAVTGGLAANAQAKYKAKIAERNASMEREAGQQEIVNGQEAALAHYRQVGQVKGDRPHQRRLRSP